MPQSVLAQHACDFLLWELMSSGVKPEERSRRRRHSENPALSYHLTGEPPDPQPGLHHRIHLTTQILLRSSTHSPQSHGRTWSDIVQASVDGVIMGSWCSLRTGLLETKNDCVFKSWVYIKVETKHKSLWIIDSAKCIHSISIQDHMTWWDQLNAMKRDQNCPQAKYSSISCTIPSDYFHHGYAVLTSVTKH